MKKLMISFLLTISIGFVLSGCGKPEKESDLKVDNVKEVQMGEEQKEDKTEDTQSEDTETEQANIGDKKIIKNDVITREKSVESGEGNRIIIENPGFDYYCDNTVASSDAAPEITLELLTKERNQITDLEKWIFDNGLFMPQFPFTDDNYYYETSGDNGYETYLLTLTDLDTKEKVTLDFSKFQYGEEYKKEDIDFIKQRITYAQVDNGILYVATSHNTYAESSPQNAYITAIDLSDYHVIWKTEPLTCNSYSFVSLEQGIVCGYGFTDEDDYLKIVNKKNGKVIEQIPIESMAEYIILKDNVIYVRTYDTNYTFQCN